jgi:hypothetical protein
MSIGLFDKIAINDQLLLSLPFREGSGLITHDEAKPDHLLTQQDLGGGSFAWGNLASGCPYLDFISVGFGATDGVYLDCPNADTLDLDFTSGDYSIVVWVNHRPVGNVKPKNIVGRYRVDAAAPPAAFGDGWEVYLETNGGVDYLELRHHHVSLGTSIADSRDGCFSTGWATGSWNLLGITRHKIAGTSWPQHYRDGLPLAMAYSTPGLRDPDTSPSDLVIGARYSKDSNWLDGMMWNLRIWSRELSGEDMRFIVDRERHWFGV